MGLFGISLNDLKGGALKTAGTIYDYATPGKGSSRVTDAGQRYFAPSAPTITVKSPNRSAPTQSAPLPDPTRASTDALLRSINSQVYAPTPNFAAINANARAGAEAAVNPVYTKYLNDFLAQQGQQKAIRTQVQDLSIKQAEQALAQTLEQNDINRLRTTEDTATNVANINTAADEYQTDTGQQFATDRLNQARTVAQSGQTGGLGAQQNEAIQTARNTEEKRQGVQTQQQLDTQELTKVRTFQDLENSGKYATQKKEGDVEGAKLSLADFIAEQGIALQNKQQDLELARQTEIIRKQTELTKQQFQQFYNTISNPAQRAAFAQAYGSML